MCFRLVNRNRHLGGGKLCGENGPRSLALQVQRRLAIGYQVGSIVESYGGLACIRVRMTYQGMTGMPAAHAAVACRAHAYFHMADR